MDIEGYNAAIGLVLPLIVGFLTTKSLPGWVKSTVSVVLITGCAVGTTLITNQFNFAGVGEALLTIGVVHQASYELFTKYFAKKLQEVGPIKDNVEPPTLQSFGQ